MDGTGKASPNGTAVRVMYVKGAQVGTIDGSSCLNFCDEVVRK